MTFHPKDVETEKFNFIPFETIYPLWTNCIYDPTKHKELSGGIQDFIDALESYDKDLRVELVDGILQIQLSNNKINFDCIHSQLETPFIQSIRKFEDMMIPHHTLKNSSFNVQNKSDIKKIYNLINDYITLIEKSYQKSFNELVLYYFGLVKEYIK